MKNHVLIILIVLLSILYGCAESDVLTNYEEVKEIAESKIPITFSAYVGDTHEETATTRADWNYLVYLSDRETEYGRFDNIPFEGMQANDHRRLGHLAYNNYIVGVYGFVHQDEWKDVAATAEADFMTNQPLLHLYKKEGGDHIIYWDYNPKKYWPNNNTAGDTNGYSFQTDKVTFISYYPYQGYSDDDLYYRDGKGKRMTDYIKFKDGTNEITIGEIKYNFFKEGVGGEKRTLEDDGFDWNSGYYGSNWKKPELTEKNLTNIVPPAKGSADKPTIGAEAYTFTFQQKENVKDHIDFMMGINPNVTKQSVSDKVVLNLRHQLCAIRYSLNFNPNRYFVSSSSQPYLEHVPDDIVITIKSIKLAGMYGKGTIAPVWDSENEKYVFQWTLDEVEPKATYTTFEKDPDQENNNPLPLTYHETWGIKDGYDPATQTLDKKYERKTPTPSDHNVNNFPKNFYVTNSTFGTYKLKGDGFKWLILALPQTPNPETCVEVTYNMEYTYTHDSDGVSMDSQTYYYEDCIDKIQLPSGTKFEAGKLMNISINFYFKGISMDAEVTEWPTDEELEVEGQIDG